MMQANPINGAKLRRACPLQFGRGMPLNLSSEQYSRIKSKLRRDAVALVAFAAVVGFFLLASALSGILP